RVHEQRENLLARQIQRIRREPDLQTQRRGRTTGELQAQRVTADQLDRVAAKVVADDGQLPPDQLGVEPLPRIGAVPDEAGVVGDALRSHAYPSLVADLAASTSLRTCMLRATSPAGSTRSSRRSRPSARRASRTRSPSNAATTSVRTTWLAGR